MTPVKLALWRSVPQKLNSLACLEKGCCLQTAASECVYVHASWLPIWCKPQLWQPRQTLLLDRVSSSSDSISFIAGWFVQSRVWSCLFSAELLWCDRLVSARAPSTVSERCKMLLPSYGLSMFEGQGQLLCMLWGTRAQEDMTGFRSTTFCKPDGHPRGHFITFYRPQGASFRLDCLV